MRKFLVSTLLALACVCLACAISACKSTVSVTGVTCTQSCVLEVGESYTIEYSVTPSDSTDQSVTFTSSDSGVASVSLEGLVTALSAGTAYVTIATTDGGYTAQCVVTVNEKSYYASFVADGVNVSTCAFTQSNKNITVPAVPEKQGYTGEWESYTLKTENITISAVYTPIEYIAEFVDDSGALLYSLSYTVEGLLDDEPQVPAKDYYTGVWEEYSLDIGGITVCAVYTPIEYTVKFVAKDNEVSSQTYTVENREITIPEIPAVDGYSAEWETFELTAGDVTINAVYTAIEYTATFMASGAKVNSVKFTVESESIEPPEVPLLNGYTGVWESFKIEAKDITITAVYTPVVYSIIYESTKEAANANAESYTVESYFALESLADVDGYVFVGWYIGDEKITAITGKYADLTITAKWTLARYTIYFLDEYGAVTIDTQYYTIEDLTITEPDVPEKDGYIGEWSSYIFNYKTTYVYAQYTPISYSITYENTKGAENANKESYTVKDQFELVELSAVGYNFEGWFFNGVKITSLSGLAADITLTAEWTLVQYKVLFCDENGNYVYSTEYYTIENTEITEPDVPQKEGYTGEWSAYSLNFDETTYVYATYTKIVDTGETDEPSEPGTVETDEPSEPDTGETDEPSEPGTGETDEPSEPGTGETDKPTDPDTGEADEPTDPDTGETDEPVEYAVTFIADSITIETVTYTEDNTQIKEPEVPAKDGYTGVWGSYTLTTGDITVYAIYTAIEYKISFYVEGALLETKTFTVETQSIAEPAIPEKVGYTAAWESYDFSIGDKSVDAIYSLIEYTVTFMADKTTVSTQTYTVENYQITEPEVPAKDGYAGEWESYALTTGDVTVNAAYTAIEYKISFYVDGLLLETKIFTVETQSIVEPTIPEKAGYTAAWETYDFTIGDKSVNAIYSIIEYTVTFVADKTTVYTQTYTVEDTQITEPEVPAKDGYTGAWESYAFTIGDVTVNAVYTAIEYKIYFYVEGALLETKTFTVETQSIVEPTIPEKAGYTAAWEAYDLTLGDKSVNAKYTIIEYTVTFKADKKTIGTQTYTVENKQITEPDIPAKVGYTANWESYELTTGDITVNAVYTVIVYTITFIADGVTVAEKTYSAIITSFTYPAVPAKVGYTGEWEQVNELPYADFTINAIYTAEEYKAYFYIDSSLTATRVFTVETKSIDEPEITEKVGYSGAWEEYNLTASDINVNAVYTLIEYKVTFKADETVVKVQTYTIENREITEPDVPEKSGYSGSWESYSLTIGDIEVNAVYIELAPEEEEGYIITYVADGKTVAEIEYVDGVPKTQVPNVPAKDGYTGEWEQVDLFCAGTINALYTSKNASSGIEYEEDADGNLIVVGYTGEGGSVNVPAVYQNKMVIAISADAFKGNTAITELILPETINEFEEGVFYGMSGLTAITIPFVGSNAEATDYTASACFGYIFGSTLYTGSSAIKQYFSTTNTSCVTYYIPSNLKTVTVLGGYIRYGAFSYCSNLTEVIILSSDGMTASIFRGCSSLKSLTLPFVGTKSSPSRASYTTLFGYIFGSETYDSATEVEQYYSDSSSKSYYIPNSLTTVTVLGGKIMYGAFYGCTKIKTIYIGEDVEYIGEKAFNKCTALKYIYFIEDSTWTISAGSSTDMTVTAGENYMSYITSNYGYTWTKKITEEE